MRRRRRRTDSTRVTQRGTEIGQIGRAVGAGVGGEIDARGDQPFAAFLEQFQPACVVDDQASIDDLVRDVEFRAVQGRLGQSVAALFDEDDLALRGGPFGPVRKVSSALRLPPPSPPEVGNTSGSGCGVADRLASAPATGSWTTTRSDVLPGARSSGTVSVPHRTRSAESAGTGTAHGPHANEDGGAASAGWALAGTRMVTSRLTTRTSRASGPRARESCAILTDSAGAVHPPATQSGNSA